MIKIPYGKQWISKEDVQAVTETLTGDFLTQGPAISKFEQAICERTGAKYCVAVCNGTAALHLAVRALDIPAGSEGITSPITFAASSNCMIYNGMRPAFADIEPKTYCIDPVEIEKKISKDTKLIVPVDLAGQPCSMKEIKAIAKKNNLAIVEDASHAIGSKYEDGSAVGSCTYSDMTTFSFHPVKTITTGEGGAITTNSPVLYEKLKLLRTHGITKDQNLLSQNPGPWYYEMIDLGFNYRITDIQAALGISQLQRLDSFIQRRREIVQRYNTAFSQLPHFTIPFEQPEVYSAWHLYIAQIDFNAINKTRVQVMSELESKGIGSQVHYIPVHFLPYYQKNYHTKSGDFPIAENYYERALSLPLYPKMNDEEVQEVIKAVTGIVAQI